MAESEQPVDASRDLLGVPSFLLRRSQGHGESKTVRPANSPDSVELFAGRIFVRGGIAVSSARCFLRPCLSFNCLIICHPQGKRHPQSKRI